jgi:hypothetical protein
MMRRDMYVRSLFRDKKMHQRTIAAFAMNEFA